MFSGVLGEYVSSWSRYVGVAGVWQAVCDYCRCGK